MRRKNLSYSTTATAYRLDRESARRKGITAAADGDPITDNPYPSFEGRPFSTVYHHGAALWRAWNLGWSEANR